MAKRTRYCLQIVICREDAFGTDKAADLKYQRIESREIDEAKRAKKEPAWNQAIRSAMLGVQQPTNGGCRSPVHER